MRSTLNPKRSASLSRSVGRVASALALLLFLSVLDAAADLHGLSPAYIASATAKEGGEGGNSGSGGHSGRGGNDHGDDDGGRRESEGSHRRFLVGPHGERIETDSGRIEIRYPDGYRERIVGDRLEMLDPRGRRIIQRAVTEEDRARIDTLLH